MYTNEVFKAIESMQKSERGEYEISSVNNYFINKDSCDCSILDGRWADAGTIGAYHKTNRLMYKNEK
jgi:glucose-1-phosphate thymidylyltransferase